MLGGYYYIKVFYLGDKYYGLQQQPNLKTIQGEIIKALRGKQYIPNKKYTGQIPVQIAGRTDKGVHARGMIFGFLNFRKDFYPIEVNMALPNDIVIWAYTKVHSYEELNEIVQEKGINEIERMNLVLDKVKKPRYNILQRHYKYFHYNLLGNLDIEKIQIACQKFIGTHEFVNFCKIEDDKKTYRTIDSVKVNQKGNLWEFDFRARSFLWYQVRKIMYTILKIGDGDWSVDSIDKLFDPKEKKLAVKIKPAHAYGLILWDIVYNDKIKFIKCEKSIKMVRMYFNKILEEISLRTEIINSIKDSF